MRYTTSLPLFSALAAAALIACGGDGGSSGGSGGSGSSSTTAGGAGGTGGTGGSAPVLVNGCDPNALEDRTADATVDITFGDALGLEYSPACIKVKSGTSVTFAGSFFSHPLSAGTVMGTVATPDASSPIQATATGTTATFTIDPAGSYPYYCADHYGSKMMGLIVAE
jgi:plastocyanin